MPSLSSSCISSVHNTGRVSFSSTEGSGTGSVNTAVRVHANQTETIATSVSPWVSATEIQCRNKSVRFKCDFDGSSSRSSSENVSQNRNKSELLGDQSVFQSLHLIQPHVSCLTRCKHLELFSPQTLKIYHMASLESGPSMCIQFQTQLTVTLSGS